MRPIQITKLTEAAFVKAFKDYLKQHRSTEGKIDFQMSYTDLIAVDKTRPLITITPEAYLKMKGLIKNCDVEIAWHGIVERLNKYNYRITDVLCYPQEVAAATVTSDDNKYPQWLMALDDDTINNLRFQGHSHVNMAASPSGVDTNNWEEFLQTLTSDAFYIFCIGNKRGDFYWTIYDLQTNQIYEPKDIDVEIELSKEKTIDTWATDEMSAYLTKHVYAANYSANNLYQMAAQANQAMGVPSEYNYEYAYANCTSPIKDKILGGYLR